MRRSALLLALLTLSACGPRLEPAHSLAAPPAAAPPAAAPAHDDAATRTLIIERSHAVLNALDRGDVPGVDALLAEDFVHIEGGHVTPRRDELERARRAKPGTSGIASRSWEQERVFTSPGRAVFLGKATETQGGNEVHGGYRYVGWYTLAWRRTATTWKAELICWQRAGANAERESWNDIYRNDVGFSKLPNRLLVETVADSKPGTALDLTMGQGRNALYLAERGWQVTGVDMSDEGIRVAREQARRRNLQIEMIEANIDTWEFGRERWDLVTMIYAGQHPKWLPRIKSSLRPGGLFVLEYFAYDPANGQDDGVKPGELAAAFSDGFEILRDQVVEDTPDWAMNHARLQRFVARKR